MLLLWLAALATLGAPADAGAPGHFQCTQKFANDTDTCERLAPGKRLELGCVFRLDDDAGQRRLVSLNRDGLLYVWTLRGDWLDRARLEPGYPLQCPPEVFGNDSSLASGRPDPQSEGCGVMPLGGNRFVFYAVVRVACPGLASP